MAVCVFYENTKSVVHFTGKLCKGLIFSGLLIVTECIVTCSCSSVGRMTVLLRTSGHCNWMLNGLESYKDVLYIKWKTVAINTVDSSKTVIALSTTCSWTTKTANRCSMMPKFNVFCPRWSGSLSIWYCALVSQCVVLFLNPTKCLWAHSLLECTECCRAQIWSCWHCRFPRWTHFKSWMANFLTVDFHVASQPRKCHFTLRHWLWLTGKVAF